MLNIEKITALAKELVFVTEDIDYGFANALSVTELDIIFSVNSKNKPIICECERYFQEIDENDFVFNWDFYHKKNIFFKCANKIIKAMVMIAFFYERINDIESAALGYINVFSKTKQLKDLGFFNDYALGKVVVEPALVFFESNIRKFSPSIKKNIVSNFLATIKSSIYDKDLVNRDEKYSTMFKKNFVEETKRDELKELSNCNNDKIEETKQFYKLALEDIEKPRTKEHLKKMEKYLKSSTARDLLIIINIATEEFVDQFHKCPDFLNQLIPDFLPQIINDPFSGVEFEYKKLNDISYEIKSHDNYPALVKLENNVILNQYRLQKWNFMGFLLRNLRWFRSIKIR